MPLTAQAQQFLTLVEEKNAPPWEDLTPRDGRELFNSFVNLFGEGPELLRFDDHQLPGSVKIRVYSDATGPLQPAAMFFHGGGWVLGNVQTHDALCRRIAKQSACTIISVDYDLAPEHSYPKPMDDCFTATKSIVENAGDFQVDPQRLAVIGDSAGGNLAAAVALRARDAGGPMLKLQILIYPVIEPNFQSESYRQMAVGYSLTRASMQWFWRQYLGDGASDHLAIPSQASSLSGLPAAHVITAEYDVLRDEGEAYARRLADSGVPTTIKRYEGNLHGFVSFAGFFDDGITAANDIATILRSRLG